MSKLIDFYRGSVTIVPFLDTEYHIYSARYQINYVRSSTGNVAPDILVGTSGVTLVGQVTHLEAQI